MSPRTETSTVVARSRRYVLVGAVALTVTLAGTSLGAVAVGQASGGVMPRVPESPDPEHRYLFYLHGRIVEDQDVKAVSPEFGRDPLCLDGELQ